MATITAEHFLRKHGGEGRLQQLQGLEIMLKMVAMAFDITISRGKIVEDFINVEYLIGSIICQQFFGEVRTDFMDKVLLDEYFSFALKRRLVQKLVKKL